MLLDYPTALAANTALVRSYKMAMLLQQDYLLEQSRATNRRLNRRCQAAESLATKWRRRYNGLRAPMRSEHFRLRCYVDELRRDIWKRRKDVRDWARANSPCLCCKGWSLLKNAVRLWRGC